jgi:hypothetical protein
LLLGFATLQLRETTGNTGLKPRANLIRASPLSSCACNYDHGFSGPMTSFPALHMAMVMSSKLKIKL